MIPQIKEQRRLSSDMVIEGWPAYATLDSATVSFEEMGDRTITAEVSIDGDITPSFDGWELVFRNEVFSLQNLAPQAVKDNSSRCSTVSLVFRSGVISDLKRYFFFAKTATETGTAIADKYKVPLGLSVADFVRAYNEVLTSYFKGQIRMELYPGTYSTETKYIDINYSYLWDVLEEFHKTYELHWRIDYNEATSQYIIKVGYPRDAVSSGHVFQYGYDGGLLKFERQVQDDTIYNVLFGRGGEKNLPYRYFKALDPNNTAFAPDPDAIPELKNIYFDRLRDSNFRSYIQGWKTNPNRDLGDITYVCENCHTVYHTQTPPEECPMCLNRQFIIGRDYGGVETYDAQRGETDWAYKKGHEDELFDPVEYEKDDDSIALYGVRHGTLDDNDDIYPTIQGSGLDEIVDVSQITSDDDGQEGQSVIKSTLVSGAHTELYEHGFLSHVITIPDITFYSDVFTIPNGYKGFKINDPAVDYANATYYVKISSSQSEARTVSVLSGANVRCDVVDENDNIVTYQELLPGNEYRIKFYFTDDQRIDLGQEEGLLRSVSLSSNIYIDIYGGDGVVVPNPTVYDSITVPAYSTAEKYLYSDDFTVTQNGAIVLDAPIKVTPPTGAVYQSTFEIINKSTHAVTQASNIPAGTYYARVKVSGDNGGSSSTTATISLRPMIVYYSDPNKPWQPTFDIWVKNIWDTTQGAGETDEEYSRRVWTPILGDRAGDTAKVVFASGFLSSSEDYEFVIASYPMPARGDDARDGAEWKITLQKSDVEYDAIGMYIPNSKSGWQAYPGDKFYFIGIDIPHMYVLLAEQRLHQTKVDALSEKAWSNPTYAVTLDKIRIHTQEEADDGIMLVDDIDAGKLMRIYDSRFSGGILSIPIRTASFVWNKTDANAQYIVPDVELVLSEKVESTTTDLSSVKKRVAYIGEIYVSDTELKKSMSRVQQKASGSNAPLSISAGDMTSFEGVSYNGTSPVALTIPSTFAHLASHPTTLSGYGITDAALKTGGSDYNFKVSSLIISDAFVSGGEITISSQNLRPVVITRSGMLITTRELAYKTEIPTDYVTLATSQSITGSKTFSALLTANGGVQTSLITHASNEELVLGNSDNQDYIRIVEDLAGPDHTVSSEDNDEEVPIWSINTSGFARFTTLLVSGVASINGHLTADSGMTLTGNSTVAGHFQPATDATYSLGYSNRRWSAINAMSVGAANLYLAKNDTTGTNCAILTAAEASQTERYLSIRVGQKSYMLYETAGFFYNNASGVSNVDLGKGDHRWANVYTDRIYLDNNSTYLYKDASNNWHIKSASGGSVNLIVDGDIACAG